MKTQRFRFAGLLAGLAALSLLAAPAAAAAAKPAAGSAPAQAEPNKPIQPSETKEFGDWSVRCYPVSSPSPCEMLELLVNKKSGRRVLGVLIAYMPSRNQHVMQIAMPLGVMLSNGAVLATDTFTSGVLKFRRCDMQGCYVETGIDNDSIAALGRATKAALQIVSVDGKKFNLAFSLNGFTAAHNALVELARQKATGVTPAAAPPAAQEGQAN
jgi:invasion protein IalB